jgi:hypothetical protein
MEIRRHGDSNETTKTRAGWIQPVLHEALTGTGSMILLGALVIGYISDQTECSNQTVFETSSRASSVCSC